MFSGPERRGRVLVLFGSTCVLDHVHGCVYRCRFAPQFMVRVCFV